MKKIIEELDNIINNLKDINNSSKPRTKITIITALPLIAKGVIDHVNKQTKATGKSDETLVAAIGILTRMQMDIRDEKYITNPKTFITDWTKELKGVKEILKSKGIQ